MIEGIKRIRKAFKRITERIKKTETAFDTKTDQALRLSENLEKMKEVRKKMMVIGEEMSKALEEKSKQINNNMKEVVFGDGKRPIVVPGIIIQKEETRDGWLVYGIRGEMHPKVVEVKICKSKREARKQKRKLHNAGNNKRKMNGQPLKRFIAKQKVRKRKVSESDTMK